MKLLLIKIDNFIDKYYVLLFLLLGAILVWRSFLIYFGQNLNVVHEDLTLFTNFNEYSHFLLKGFNDYYSIESIRSLYYFVFLIGRLRYIFPIFIWLIVSGLGIAFYYSSKRIYSLIANAHIKGLPVFLMSCIYLLYFLITKGHHFYHVLPGAILFPIQFWLILEIAKTTKIFYNSKLYLFFLTLLLGGNIHHIILVVIILWAAVVLLNRRMLLTAFLGTGLVLLVLYPSYIAGDFTETAPLTQNYQEYAGSMAQFLINPYERILSVESTISYTRQHIQFYVIFLCFVLGLSSIITVKKLKLSKYYLFMYALLVFSILLSFGLAFADYSNIYKLLVIPVIGKLVTIWLNIFRFPTRLMLVAIPLTLMLGLFVLNKYRKWVPIFAIVIILQIALVPAMSVLFKGNLGGRYEPSQFSRLTNLPVDSKVLYYPTFISAELNGRWITEEFIILNNGYRSIETSNTGGSEFNMKYALLPYYLASKNPGSETKLNDYFGYWGINYVVINKNIKLITDNLNITQEFYEVFDHSDLKLIEENDEQAVYSVTEPKQVSNIYYGNLYDYWEKGIYENQTLFNNSELLENNISKINVASINPVPTESRLSLPELYKLFDKKFLLYKRFLSPGTCMEDLELCLRSNGNSLTLNKIDFAKTTSYINKTYPNAKLDYYFDIDNDVYYFNHYYTSTTTMLSNKQDFKPMPKYILIIILYIFLMHYFLLARRRMIILNGIDGSGKTSLASNLSKNGYGKYLHYYPPNSNKKISKNKFVSKDQFFVSYIKEVIFSFYRFVCICLIAYRRDVILDRTFVDVYVDLQSRFGNKFLLKIFLIEQKMFNFIIAPFAKSILLELNNPKTIIARKNDENIKSASLKIKLYKLIDPYFRKHYRVNTEKYSLDKTIILARDYAKK